MIIGVLQVCIHIPAAQSLKQKKKPVNQMLDKVADLIRQEDRAQMIESHLEFF